MCNPLLGRHMPNYACMICWGENALSFCRQCPATHICGTCRWQMEIRSTVWCPTCHCPMDLQPLEASRSDAFLPGPALPMTRRLSTPVPTALPVTRRPSAPVPNLTNLPDPPITYFDYGGITVPGIRVGVGNPAAGWQFYNTLAFCLLIPSGKLQIAICTAESHPRSVALLRQTWNIESCVIFDHPFAQVATGVRSRRMRYCIASQIQQGGDTWEMLGWEGVPCAQGAV